MSMRTIKNSLLAYVNFFRRRSPTDEVKNVVLDFYTSTEIREAKELLVANFGSHFDVSQPKAGRRRSVSRETKKEETSKQDDEVSPQDADVSTPDVDVSTPDIRESTSDIKNTPDIEVSTPDGKDTPDVDVSTSDVEEATPDVDEGTEVDQIIDMFDLLGSSSTLDGIEFSIVALNRLPGLCEPKEINDRLTTDRQVRLDALLTDLSATLVALTVRDAQVPSALGDVTSAVEKMNSSFYEVTGGINHQLDHLTTTCGKLVETFLDRRTPPIDNKKAPSVGNDRRLNVVVSGVRESKNGSVWREELVTILQTAARKDITIRDAFRLGRFTFGRTRPLLVSLKTAWDRRLVLGGLRNLNEVDAYRGRIYIAPDELLETRRRAQMERLRRWAEREGRVTLVRDGGVLEVDGVEVFSVVRGYNRQISNIGAGSILAHDD